MAKQKEKKTPRRANGEGSVTYKEDKKLYYARITVGKDEKGNYIRKSEYFKRPTDAYRWLTTQKALQLKGIDLSGGNVTFGQLGSEWLATKKVTVAPNTYEAQTYFFKHLAEFEKEKVPIVAQKMQKFINKKAEALSPASVKKIWSIAKQIFDIAYDRDIIMKIPKVKLPRLIERIPNTITLDDMNKLVQASQKHDSKYSHGIWLEFGTGLRRSEMLALDWEDFDFNQNTITIKKSLVRVNGKFILNHHTKTQAGFRKIPVPQLIMDKLKKISKEKGHVFKTDTGTYLSPWNWSRLFRSWRKTAGLEEIRFHDLRHQFATMLMETGTHARVAQNMTGHADMPTLLERYTHVQPELMKEAAEKLNEALKPLT